ncbi:MAG: T9SS type A sorting domain-containing protein [Flavobacteriaceae bacterium]
MKKNYLLILFLLPSILLSQTESAILNIDATIPYQGEGEAIPLLGSAEYKIFYSGNDAVIDKPIIFVDGFDPNDSRDIPSMYSLLDYGSPTQNLGDIVRSEGFDLIVLNFPEEYFSPTDGTSIIRGGADFIQRNAFILVELLNVINSLKVGAEENVIIGPSMGGLISRYALAYMEDQSMDHETRLYVSFDSPHLGANVPIGIQYTFNYMLNGDPGVTDLQPLVDGLLNSSAAKQMLIDHYLGHVNSGGVNQDGSTHTPKGAPNFRDAFQTELDALGFPQDSRNIAVANGSGTGQQTGTPGMELINHVFNIATGTDATVDIHFAPLASQSITVSDISVTFFGFPLFSFSATAESTALSDGIDSAPGGLFDLYSFDDGTNALVTEFVNNLNSQYFNFIPTLSSLAIGSETDWYAVPNENDSPFDNVYIPTNNEPHVMLTEGVTGNVEFVLQEIRQGTLSIGEINNYNIKLAENPISKELTILSNKNIDKAEIIIVDLTGKIVYKNKISLTNKTRIPLELSSGLYVLNITNRNKVFKTKLVVNN